MPSEEQRERNDERKPREQNQRLRPIAKVNEERVERLSGDHIHLSPRAQRRMAMGRRSGARF